MQAMEPPNSAKNGFLCLEEHLRRQETEEGFISYVLVSF